ncbi:asparagine synthase (glutamine-hydrolyzing) [Maridesulfovibrio ferrireducens]|uniref:asparagine synthase (glutamine-hydrolyzing) n=1 Tax=Maridesulfovibrio ferrireducens TaxID=246191 RepID=UPI001A217555|nr:asparagine synthase (glutamine-hydrolyzing) [Maridesulfovibrio ferrireducens]MBI9111244.1 asparagine synthase (glutamine-hydrolyzing) [Maridesulfovibrio ferrireducens]
MCGILGAINSSVKFDLSSLHHRGPDGQGVWEDGDCCRLGHTRLSIIDLDQRASQPMVSRSSRFVIVFNGEIYNYKEIKKEFLPDFDFRTTSDTEVLLELWELMGPDCIRHFRGMFAFAIWDRREKELFLVRDRLGKKPLVFSCGNGSLSFASELDALVGLLPQKPEIDPRAMDLFLAYQFIPHPFTIYKNCEKLPPAHFAKYKDGQLTIQRYWSIKFDPDYSITEDEAFESLEEQVRESVKLRMRSDVEVGVLLSGGVDSSLVAAVAAKESGKRLKTFSVGFDYGKSELEHAAKAAQACNSIHKPASLDEKTAGSLFADMVNAYGEPYGDNSALPSLFVCAHAASEVKVALNGDGGDELMGGYGKYSPKAMRQLMTPFASFGYKVGCDLDTTANRLFNSPGILKFADRLGSSLSPYIKVVRFNHFFSSQYRKALYRPEVFKEVLDIRSEYEKKLISELPLTGPLMCRLQSIDYRHYFVGDLMAKMDIAGMRNSLETRSPLMDHKLFEFAATLPPEFKIKNGETKYLLKKLAAKYLPREIIYRPKTGFSVPVSNWAETVFKQKVSAATANPNHPLWNYLNRDFVKKMAEGSPEQIRKNGHRIWLLSVLCAWTEVKR